MTNVAPSLIAVLGTLLGGVLAFLLQNSLAKRQLGESRRDNRRADYIAAATDLASAVSTLIQAEYARAKLRFDGVNDERRDRARQDVYDKRTATRTATFRLQLIGDPAKDAALVEAGEALIEQCRGISTHSTTMNDADSRTRIAKAGLEALIGDAHRRVVEI